MKPLTYYEDEAPSIGRYFVEDWEFLDLLNPEYVRIDVSSYKERYVKVDATVVMPGRPGLLRCQEYAEHMAFTNGIFSRHRNEVFEFMVAEVFRFAATMENKQLTHPARLAELRKRRDELLDEITRMPYLEIDHNRYAGGEIVHV